MTDDLSARLHHDALLAVDSMPAPVEIRHRAERHRQRRRAVGGVTAVTAGMLSLAVVIGSSQWSASRRTVAPVPPASSPTVSQSLTTSAYQPTVPARYLLVVARYSDIVVIVETTKDFERYEYKIATALAKAIPSRRDCGLTGGPCSSINRPEGPLELAADPLLSPAVVEDLVRVAKSPLSRSLALPEPKVPCAVEVAGLQPDVTHVATYVDPDRPFPPFVEYVLRFANDDVASVAIASIASSYVECWQNSARPGHPTTPSIGEPEALGYLGIDEGFYAERTFAW